ncbi:uncharacterized protein LOC112126790 [Cimex lectularius]|uniref:RNase H type-1 domain-containing protein n=1 Tax=Cimex lectularius TaxID=79782 RepID=A0A8I6SF34_CIMLE|nr:uncharacterized protein LOC112126790 [Cimex lectularius]
MFRAYLRANLANYYLLFTDGSKVDGKVGFAIYDPVRDTNEGYSLPGWASIFSAESMGVLKALEYTQYKLQNVTQIAILTDSRSVVSHLENINTYSKCDHVTMEILLRYRDLVSDGKSVTLCWIKGHSGIRENEIVDRFAKEAVVNGSFFDYKMTKCDAKRALNRVWLRDWQLLHDGSQGGQLYRLRFPMVPKKPWFQGCTGSRRFFSTMVRIRTNHGLWGAHRFRIGVRDSPNCATCDKPEDLNHLIMECPEHEERRKIFLERIYSLQCVAKPFSLESLISEGRDAVYMLLYQFTKGG